MYASETRCHIAFLHPSGDRRRQPATVRESNSGGHGDGRFSHDRRSMKTRDSSAPRPPGPITGPGGAHPATGPGSSRASPAGGPVADPWTDGGLLTLALIWGVNFSVIKVALDVFHPLAFNALRFPLAALLLSTLLVARGPVRLPARGDWPRLMALGVLGNVVYQIFFIFGMDATRAGNASLLLATTPVWTTVLSSARGHERIPSVVWGGIVGTVLGMALVVLGSGAGVEVDRSTLVGDLLMIGASMTWSVYTVGSRRLIARYGSLPVTAWTLWIGTVGLLAMGALPLLRTSVRDVPLAGWLGVLYAGLLGIGVAYALWYRGVQRLGSTRTAAFSNLVPVVALAVAWAWLGEVPSALQIVGAAVIIASVSVARFSGSAPKPRRTGQLPGA